MNITIPEAVAIFAGAACGLGMVLVIQRLVKRLAPRPPALSRHVVQEEPAGPGLLETALGIAPDSVR